MHSLDIIVMCCWSDRTDRAQLVFLYLFMPGLQSVWHHMWEELNDTPAATYPE